VRGKARQKAVGDSRIMPSEMQIGKMGDRAHGAYAPTARAKTMRSLGLIR
jgi:hypothetical protein